jgi:hypothetical protein
MARAAAAMHRVRLFPLVWARALRNTVRIPEGLEDSYKVVGVVFGRREVDCSIRLGRLA